MCFKPIKSIVTLALIAVIVAGVVFGKDMVSYLRSSTTSMQRAVKDAIPVEFELQRARDLLEEIIPEMQANIKLIAQEEVEVAALNSDIAQSEKRLDKQEQRVSQLRRKYDTFNAAYASDTTPVDRENLTRQLSQHFDRFKEAQAVLKSKHRLLASRQQSLSAAVQLLERTRTEKTLLAGKIEMLQSQHRLVQAASVGSRIQIDGTKLAQTEKLIGQIKKRLDVAERILAHESRFVDNIAQDEISEEDLLRQVDKYFSPSSEPIKPMLELSDATGENHLSPPLL